MIQYLDLADFLLRAEAVLGIDAETLYLQAEITTWQWQPRTSDGPYHQT